jgi:LysR family glycine cleavage system transcriptional activator
MVDPDASPSWQPGAPADVRANAMPPFAALRAFEAVGRVGGIRKAAAALQVDSAVVSRHIRRLESWLGTTLIDRNRGSNILTASGERYHQRISAAIADIADATFEMLRWRQDPHLLIWSVPGFTAQWLAREITAFGAAHPGVDIEVKPTDAVANLSGNEADADIRYYMDSARPLPVARGVRRCEIARPAVIPVASPAVAASLGALTVADLAAARLLHEEDDEQWRLWLAGNDHAVADPIPGPRLWHAHLAIAAAIRGEGVALVNAFLTAEEVGKGLLVPIRTIDRPDNGVRIGAYHLSAREDRWTLPGLVELRRWLTSAAEAHSARFEPTPAMPPER